MEEQKYTFYLTEADGKEYSYTRTEKFLTQGERQLLVSEAMENFKKLPEAQKVEFLHILLLELDKWYPDDKNG